MRLLKVLSLAVLTTMAFLAIASSYMRTQAIIIGYEIGKFKSEESNLLAKRAALKSQHALLTSKQSLMTLSGKQE